MKISAFTLDELNLFRSQCSFTESEAACFELKARDETDVAIAFALNVSASTVSVIKRRMRSKIDEVLRQNVRKAAYPQQYPSCGNCQQRVLHTMAEWARLPDFISVKGQEYVYTDYRTEKGVDYPRSKMGDGVNYVSELPFYTSCLTEEDIDRWDNKPDTTSNDFGKIIKIDNQYVGDKKFKFPTKGYVTLEFNSPGIEHAEVRIYGASGQTYFTLSKYTERDNQSKEIMVEKGMQCEYVSASDNAEIKFYPLV